ncbi:hypothetical protein ABBQ38_015058 [Trebouxia sp. C0009 RCD-2024]
MMWLRACLLSLLLFCSLAIRAQTDPSGPKQYFWNEITGETQYEDPGDVPLHDEQGNCYWLDETGQKLDHDPDAGKYAWVETWSEEHNRPFYYDQANHISTWDKPADLAWRRVYILPETEADMGTAV